MIPKFRAWDKYDDEMVTDINFSWQDCGYESLSDVFSDDRWIFMQSTGLFDKNGVEIFEGDVVQSQASPHQEDWKNWKVFWNDGAFQADYKDIPADKRRRPTNEVEEVCQDNVNLYGWAVLGNIHEHPHLVEGT